MSEAKQSRGRIFFEKKDEAFTNKKNSKKDDFLILFFKFFFKAPHPNPLPTSGERGLWRRFFSKSKLKNPLDIFLRFFIYYRKLIHQIPSPRLRGEA